MNKILLLTFLILIILLIVKRDKFQTVYDQKIIIKNDVFSKNVLVNKKLKHQNVY